MQGLLQPQARPPTLPTWALGSGGPGDGDLILSLTAERSGCLSSPGSQGLGLWFKMWAAVSRRQCSVDASLSRWVTGAGTGEDWCEQVWLYIWVQVGV